MDLCQYRFRGYNNLDEWPDGVPIFRLYFEVPVGSEWSVADWAEGLVARMTSLFPWGMSWLWELEGPNGTEILHDDFIVSDEDGDDE